MKKLFKKNQLLVVGLKGSLFNELGFLIGCFFC